MTQTEMRRRKARRRAIVVIIVFALCLVPPNMLCADGRDKYRDAFHRSEEREHGCRQEPTLFPLMQYKAEMAPVPDIQVKRNWEGTEDKQEGSKNEKSEVESQDKIYLSDAIPLDYDTQTLLREWCDQYIVPYSLALGVIEAESSFTPDARNRTCFGYMQVNSINQEWLEKEIGVKDLTDPLQNLQSGVFILGSLYEKYGDWNKVLVCYNCGEKGAYNNFFSQGLTSSRYSHYVLELQEKWIGVIDL